MLAVDPPALRPMRLLRIPEPFDHSDWLYELKFGAFLALAHCERLSLPNVQISKTQTED